MLCMYIYIHCCDWCMTVQLFLTFIISTITQHPSLHASPFSLLSSNTPSLQAYTSYERQDIQMKENIKHEKGNIKKLEGKVVTETKKIIDAQTSMENAEVSIPALQQRIEECTQHKSSEDIKLESIFEETKGITEQLRLELEEKTEELAPLQQERTVFQNSLDTAQMEVNLLEDTVSRALEQLDNAEKEQSSLDSKQSSKRDEFEELTKKLASSKERVGEAEGELKELTQKNVNQSCVWQLYYEQSIGP